MTTHHIAGRNWKWTAEDRSCWRYLEAHWKDATAALKYIPEHRRQMCVQAGGNFGVWPWLLAAYFEQVMTFEPDPVNMGFLLDNVAATRNIRALPFGLGATRSLGQMHKSRRNHGAHRINFSGTGDVLVVPLDSYELPVLDLLDLDIEGAEPYALEGAKETIARCKPVIVIEQWRAWDPKKKAHSRGHEKELYNNDYSGGQWLLDHGYKLVDRVTQDEIYVPA